jgi:hypothetical protein
MTRIGGNRSNIYELPRRSIPDRGTTRPLDAEQTLTAIKRRYGGGVFGSHAELARLVRCRPAFASVKPVNDFCNHDLCVYCWARRARDCWLETDPLLFAVPPGKKYRRRRFPCDLVCVNRIFQPPDLKAYRGDKQTDLAAILADRCSDEYRTVGPLPRRSPEMRGLEYLGALDRLAVIPQWKSPEGWRIELRQVFVVEPGGQLKLPGSRQRRFENPSRKKFAKAIAWLWRYPRGFLIAGRQPHRSSVISRYLEARKGRRLSAAYGLFRQSAPKPRARERAEGV